MKTAIEKIQDSAAREASKASCSGVKKVEKQ